MPVCQLRSTDSKHVPRGSPAKWLAAATNWQSAEESGRLSLISWRQSRRFSLLIKKKCLMPWLMNLTSLLISVNYIIEKWRVRTFRKLNPLTNMRILLRQQLYRNHQAPLFPINLSTKKKQSTDVILKVWRKDCRQKTLVFYHPDFLHKKILIFSILTLFILYVPKTKAI